MSGVMTTLEREQLHKEIEWKGKTLNSTDGVYYEIPREREREGEGEGGTKA